jgi:hypothetical protein
MASHRVSIYTKYPHIPRALLADCDWAGNLLGSLLTTGIYKYTIPA